MVQVKAMHKEAANILKDLLDISGFKSKVAERVFVREDRVHLGRMQADGSNEAFLHVMTPQGQRNALKRVDYAVRPLIKFTLKVLNESIATKTPDKEAIKAQEQEPVDDNTTDKAPAKKKKAKAVPKKKIKPIDYLKYIYEYACEGGLGADRSQGHGKFDLVSIEQIEG